MTFVRKLLGTGVVFGIIAIAGLITAMYVAFSHASQSGISTESLVEIASSSAMSTSAKNASALNALNGDELQQELKTFDNLRKNLNK